MAGNVRDGARRCGAEDHPGVMRCGHRHQQRKASAHVGATSERDLPNDETVAVVDVSHSMWVDPVPCNEFGSLPCKGVGLVGIRRGARLVHQLAHPLQQDVSVVRLTGGIG